MRLPFNYMFRPFRQKSVARIPPVNSCCILLLLVGKLGGSNVTASQLDSKDALHRTQDLLVGSTGPPLEVGNYGLRGVASVGEILLGHLGFHLLSGRSDSLSNHLTHSVGLDDFVRSVDLGQALTLGAASGLQRQW